MPVNSEQDCCWLGREVGMQWETGFDLLLDKHYRDCRLKRNTRRNMVGDVVYVLDFVVGERQCLSWTHKINASVENNNIAIIAFSAFDH